MSKGQYVVYERASKGEERFFLDIAKEVVDEVGEPDNWNGYDSDHPGGRPLTYTFRQMILILLLMVHHRKEYREMEAHLNNNPHLLQELGMKRSWQIDDAEIVCGDKEQNLMEY